MTSVASTIKALPAGDDVFPAEPAPLGARLGRIVAVDGDGVPCIDFEGNPHGPLAARIALSAVDAAGLAGAWRDVDVLVVFAGQDIRQPLIAGVVRSSLEACRQHVDDWSGYQALRLRAVDELSLQCGEARMVLSRDGRIRLMGLEIQTRAKGRHCIRGGTVEIN